MLLHMGVFGHITDRTPAGPGYKAAFSTAFADFGAWRKSMKVACSQKRFNYYGLFKQEYGTFPNAKGHNARVVGEWLQDVLTRVREQDWPDPLGPRTLGRERHLIFDERTNMAEVCMILVFFFFPTLKF